MAINYTINLARAGSELEVGKLVLVDTGTRRHMGSGIYYSTAVGKVLEYADGKGVIDVEGLGRINAVTPRQNQSGLGIVYPDREIPLLAVNPLETDDAVAVLHYLDSVAKRADNRPVAFHVTSVGQDGVARGRVIGEDPEPEDSGLRDQFVAIDELDGEDPLPMGLEPVGMAYVTSEMPCTILTRGDFLTATSVPAEIREGDILIAHNCSFEIKNGEDTVRLVNANVIGNAETTGEAVSFLGLDAPRAGRHWQSPSLSGPGILVHFHGMAVAATQPDKALVAFFNDPNGTRRMALLGSSGYHAYINDDLSSYLEGDDLEPGLWTKHNLKNVSHQDREGNWDAEVEGDWLPATLADIEELFGPLDALDADLAYSMEIDPEEGLAKRMIQSAEKALFEEQFAERHREFATRRFGVTDKSHWTARQVVNPSAIEAYVSAAFKDIENKDVRELATAMFVREVRSRSSQFVEVVPTEDERAEIAGEPNWRKDPPRLFLPTEALASDLETFSAAIRANEATIAKGLKSGKNYGVMDIHHLMRQLSPSRLSASDLPLFSPALLDHGAWHFVGREKKWITLALFVDGVHVATLKTDMHRHSLTTAWGLNITHPQQNLQGSSYWASPREVVMAADRAVCEIEARHWRDHDLADFCAPTRDGVHVLNHSVAYIENGVLHRTDGPALQRGPFFSDEEPLMEHRFRGNLHREDGPAEYQGEHCVWYLHGLEHRTDGPSTILGQGDFEYRRYGVLHREDGPAIESQNHRSFYLNDRLHRDGAPSLIDAHGETWHRHGMIHREDAPAISMSDGHEVYCINGVLHNENGPAFVGADGEVTYALNGVEMSEGDYLALRYSAAASRVPTP